MLRGTLRLLAGAGGLKKRVYDGDNWGYYMVYMGCRSTYEVPLRP